MKAVNLVPADARRGRAGGRAGPAVNVGAIAPVQFVALFLVIVVVLILLRVLADNNLNNKKATLVAAQSQVAAEQAQAAKLQVFVNFVAAAQARESQAREIAEQRFPWKRTFDQISHVLPASTSLSSLSATTAPAATTNSVGAAVTGPTFTLAGCAATPNLNGVATLLRRLNDLKGVLSVGFGGSTRSGTCGNSFTTTLTFNSPGPAVTAPDATTPAVPTTTTTTTATTTTTVTTTG